MTYDSLKKQLKLISGGTAHLRIDNAFCNKNCTPTFYIVEFSITNHDLFYQNIPAFAKYVFQTPTISDAIIKYNQKGFPYFISFPVEIDSEIE